MTFNDFWNENMVAEIFLVGFGCAGGQTLRDTTDDDVADEDYCDLNDCLLTGLIRTPKDREDRFFSGYGDLEGSVSTDGNTWTWNGEGSAWDSSMNDYYQIKLFAN